MLACQDSEVLGSDVAREQGGASGSGASAAGASGSAAGSGEAGGGSGSSAGASLAGSSGTASSAGSAGAGAGPLDEQPPPAPGAEGGACLATGLCNAGLSCDWSPMVCPTDLALGTCRTALDDAAMAPVPACGCNGKWYGSVRSASLHGIPVTSNTSLCPLPEAVDPPDDAKLGLVCGGFPGDPAQGWIAPGDCGTGNVCLRVLSVSCGFSDETGVCARVPTLASCPPPSAGAEVCDCEQRLFPSLCIARALGVSDIEPTTSGCY